MTAPFTRLVHLLTLLSLVVPLAFGALPAAAAPRDDDRRSESHRPADRDEDRQRDERGDDGETGAPEPTEETGDAAEDHADRRAATARQRRPSAGADGVAESPRDSQRIVDDGNRSSRESSAEESASDDTSRLGAAEVEAADDDDDGCEIVDANDDDQLDGYCDNQAVIRLGPGAKLRQFLSEYRLRLEGAIPARRTYLVRFAPTPNDRAFAQRLNEDRRTVWAELNFADQAPEGRPRHFYSAGQTTPGVPRDAYAVAKLRVADAGCVTGAGIRVAVIDTGVDATHPAFGDNVEPGQAFFIRQPAAPGNTDPATGRMGGHGTHVAGIIDQVAPGATIVPVKALDADGYGNAFTLAQALDYASGQAQVINLSLGSTFASRTLGDAITQVFARGDLVVAAAGNSGAPAPAEFPASYLQALSVASTNQEDRRSDFSTYNGQVDLAAPGTEIVSAFPGGEYRTWSGTSMATPWVTGAVTLLLQNGASGTKVEQRLKASAEPIVGDSTGMGAGRLDVGAAVGCGA